MGKTDAEKAASAARKKVRDDARHDTDVDSEARLLAGCFSTQTGISRETQNLAQESDTDSSSDSELAEKKQELELKKCAREAQALAYHGTFPAKKTEQPITSSGASLNTPPSPK